MRGSIVKRYEGSYNIIIDDYVTDPKTGGRKRKRHWFTVHGTKKDAEKKLAELLNDKNKGQFVAPSKLTLGEWLDTWLKAAIKPPNKRLSTYMSYESVVRKHIKPVLGAIRLQELRSTQLKEYYSNSTLSQRTLEKHHMIIHGALKAAVLEGLVQRNVADLVVGKPHGKKGHEDVLQNCWEADEAQKFLEAAKDLGPQTAALYALALDTGARKNELVGLKWQDVDLEKGEVRIVRQLVKPGSEPVFGPVKNGLPRTITIAPETVALLKKHKAHQAEVKMANRTTYNDHGLVFAKEWEHRTRNKYCLGDPLPMNHTTERKFHRLIKAAGVRRITFHGLRHTSATLLLKAGVPAKVVQERLGHKKISITLDIYAHVLPGMQEDAARKMSAILFAK